MNEVIYLGNYFGFTGRSFDGQVFNIIGLSPPLLSSNSHGNVPKIVVKQNDNRNVLQKSRD